MQLYNTASRQLENVPESKTIRFYTCGPTVYDYAHIGNFRTFIFEDVLRRTLKLFGHTVDQVMNLTDVDDKTIRGAIAKNISLDAFTKTFKDAFFEDLATLNIERVEHYPAATDYIPQMIAMIEKLISKKFAYIGQDKSVYFGIRGFKEYGKLSHLKLDELQQGIRVNNDEYAKDNASDFVLWKAYDPERDGSIYWESPFGKGRPGWHLECSCMAQDILGDTIDIHAGGVDLIFPHHENEIAQSECCSGKLFSHLWVHSEHLLVDGKKMSKSLGNFYTLRDILQRGYSGKVLRFMLLHTHYRTQLNFTFQGLDSAKATLARIHDFMVRLDGYTATGEGWKECNAVLDQALSGFKAALGNDLNISEALSFFFELMRQVNAAFDAALPNAKDLAAIKETVAKIDSVLGICQFEEEAVPAEIQKLVDDRQLARKNKEWKRSDEIRAELTAKGYALEDTPSGPRVKKV
ncbi:MAG: cysteine--tRNA ligase [Verrucomicrobia bacterium]|nr:cysteine--tRNA ligase [Verrucomicrobiota bacterium]MBS0637686.1 cysteine--tRNA ligase [Verrucomicrobiota bacterium]